MYRDGWEQGTRAWATSIRHTESTTVVSHDLLYRGAQQLSLLKTPMTITATTILKISLLRFSPHRFSYSQTPDA